VSGLHINHAGPAQLIAGNDYHQADKLPRMTNKNLAEYYAKRALQRFH